MLSLSLPGRVFLCTLPTDMRKSFDSLVGLVEQERRAGMGRHDERQKDRYSAQCGCQTDQFLCFHFASMDFSKRLGRARVRLWIEWKIFKARAPALASLQPPRESIARFSAGVRQCPCRPVSEQDALEGCVFSETCPRIFSQCGRIHDLRRRQGRGESRCFLLAYFNLLDIRE